MTHPEFATPAEVQELVDPATNIDDMPEEFGGESKNTIVLNNDQRLLIGLTVAGGINAVNEQIKAYSPMIDINAEKTHAFGSEYWTGRIAELKNELNELKAIEKVITGCKYIEVAR